jgi:hypothetical protein
MNEGCTRCCDTDHSATSIHYDIGLDNNTSLSEAWQFWDANDTTWNLNGCSFAMDIQVTYYDLAPKMSLSSAAGTIVVADPVQRVIYLNADSTAVQAALTPGVYVYDLVMTDALGVKTALLHGFVKVSQGVTGV